MPKKDYVPSPWQEDRGETAPVNEPVSIDVCLSLEKEDWQTLAQALDRAYKHFEDAGLAPEADALSAFYLKVQEQIKLTPEQEQ